MKIVINGNTYTEFDSLEFSPETDLTNDSLPINEFEARLFTNAQISYGQWAELKDDNNNLWAKYWLSYAERIGRDDDKETYIVRLIGRSILWMLDQIELDPKMYKAAGNHTATSVLDEVFYGVTYLRNLSAAERFKDNSVKSIWDNTSIIGYCPRQTARERLQWLLVVTGCYIESYFDSNIAINKVSTTDTTVIPIEKTYWKPVISHRDYVTALKIHQYQYTQLSEEPTNMVNYLRYEYQSGGQTIVEHYMVTGQVVTITNGNAPSGAPENVIDIDDLNLVNSSNASAILMNLVAYYFNRTEVELDVINNGEYKPGQLVTVYTDDDALVKGYINRCQFEFGLQAKSGLHLTAAESVDGAKLIIQYKWGSIIVAQQGFFLPKNHSYSITTQYIDTNLTNHRYIFRPLTDEVSGTLTADTIETVNVEVALEYYAEPVSDRSVVNAQEQEVLAYINDHYNFLMLYKTNENIRKVLQLVYAKWRKTCIENFNIMRQGSVSKASILKVLSVDEITVETSEERNVVIIS